MCVCLFIYIVLKYIRVYIYTCIFPHVIVCILYKSISIAVSKNLCCLIHIYIHNIYIYIYIHIRIYIYICVCVRFLNEKTWAISRSRPGPCRRAWYSRASPSPPCHRRRPGTMPALGFAPPAWKKMEKIAISSGFSH